MSKFQDSVARPNFFGHKKSLDRGRKDLTKRDQPFNQARPVDKSNAFLAKEEHEDDLEEVSAAGAVAGHVGQPNKKEKKEVVKMQSREKLVNELNVRKTISKMLDIQKKRMIKETIQNKNALDFVALYLNWSVNLMLKRIHTQVLGLINYQYC